MLKPIIYEKELLKNMLDQPIVDCLNRNTLVKKGSTSFNQPFTFSVGVNDISEYSFLSIDKIYEYEKYLYLAMQIPLNNKSSISILEGNYINNTSKNNIIDISCFNNDFNSQVLNNNLSLLAVNDGVIRPFSEKLMQYILNNTIFSHFKRESY